MGQATDVISARTSDAVEQGRGAVERQVGQRSAQLGSQIGAASHTIRQVADQARIDGNDQQARLAEEAANRADRVSNYLGEVDPERLMADAEDFARRQPWLVASRPDRRLRFGTFAEGVERTTLRASVHVRQQPGLR